MNETTNKSIIKTVMAALAEGDGKPFIAAMAEQFTWHLPGSTFWSGTYHGKTEVQENLLQPLFAQFSNHYTNTLKYIYADGDIVIVECQGHVTTQKGKDYSNNYCWIIRMENGMMIEMREYMDTDLVNTALDAPKRRA